MTFDKLKQMRDDLQDARCAIAEVKMALRQRLSATEVKFDPNQPRAPQGTPTGGQWTNTGGGSGQSARARKPPPPPAPPPPKARPPQTLGNIPRAASRVSLPLIAGAVGIQRAAGTYAAEVSGQSKTPFLHIPYQKPTVGSLPARRGGAVTRRRSSPSVNLRASESDGVNRQCDINLNNDLKTCSRTAKQFGRRNGEESKIFKICEATAMDRYSECLNGGGIHAIRTPLYNGRYHRGG
ncbi:hypothetical protein [Candidatus Phycosocius spiralis]|uniref:hypothetical protein n=1 Tax=Candidatus Phycosocius spiralis TaxID=2815099 RepID=UPI0024E0E7DC|nr:hypothetical protein [Candidatus Phycosocius spiralis]